MFDSNGNGALDLSDVSENGTGIEPGDYTLTVLESELKTTREGSGKYIRCILSVEGRGTKVYHNFNVVNKNDMAVKIGKGQLKAMLRCGGYKTPDSLKDIYDLNGLSFKARIKLDERGYPEISVFKPLKEEKAAAVATATKAPF